jgi:hypothetical protein
MVLRSRKARLGYNATVSRREVVSDYGRSPKVNLSFSVSSDCEAAVGHCHSDSRTETTWEDVGSLFCSVLPGMEQ